MIDREMMRAMEADGEKLRQITGMDHGPGFPCEDCSNPDFCTEHRKCWQDWAKYHYFEYE